MCVHRCVHACMRERVRVRLCGGQRIPCSSFPFLLSCESWGLNLGCPAWVTLTPPSGISLAHCPLWPCGPSLSLFILAPDLVSSFSDFDTAWDILAHLLTHFLSRWVCFLCLSFSCTCLYRTFLPSRLPSLGALSESASLPSLKIFLGLLFSSCLSASMTPFRTFVLATPKVLSPPLTWILLS